MKDLKLLQIRVEVDILLGYMQFFSDIFAVFYNCLERNV